MLVMVNLGYVDEDTFSRMCNLLGVSVEEMRSKRRSRYLIYRRVILGRYLDSMGLTHEYVGKMLGNRRHTCVNHYHKIYDNEIGYNKTLQNLEKIFMEGVESI